MPTALTPADRLVLAALRQLANQQHQQNDDAAEFTISAARLGDRVAPRVGLTDDDAQAAFARLVAADVVRLVDDRGAATHPKHPRRYRFADDTSSAPSTSRPSTPTTTPRVPRLWCGDCAAQPITARAARADARCESCRSKVGRRRGRPQYVGKRSGYGDDLDPFAVA